MESSIRVVPGQIEGRTANPGREPGNRIRSARVRVPAFLEVGEQIFLETISQFKGMARLPESQPRARQFLAEYFQALIARLVGERRRPNPLDTQRSFAPALRPVSPAILDSDPGACAGDFGQGLGPE